VKRDTALARQSRITCTPGREVSDIGLYFYKARWYDSALGRFSQADTIVPGAGDPRAWDRYAYVKNNPVVYNDPSGHYCTATIDGKASCIPKSIYKALIKAEEAGDRKLLIVDGWANTDSIPNTANMYSEKEMGGEVFRFEFEVSGEIWSPTKEVMAEKIKTEIINNPNITYSIIGFSAGGAAVIWALDTLPDVYKKQVTNVVLIEPAYEDSTPGRSDNSSNLISIYNDYKTIVIALESSIFPKEIDIIQDKASQTHLDVSMSLFTETTIQTFLGLR
jgi:RHS repeat-associated protein